MVLIAVVVVVGVLILLEEVGRAVGSKETMPFVFHGFYLSLLLLLLTIHSSSSPSLLSSFFSLHSSHTGEEFR